MIKSLCRVCFGKEERLKKKSPNGKFRETEVKTPLGFLMVCVTTRDWFLLLEALGHSRALSSLHSQFHIHTLARDSSVSAPCSLALVPCRAVGHSVAPEMSSESGLCLASTCVLQVPNTSGCSGDVCGAPGVVIDSCVPYALTPPLVLPKSVSLSPAASRSLLLLPPVHPHSYLFYLEIWHVPGRLCTSALCPLAPLLP